MRMPVTPQRFKMASTWNQAIVSGFVFFCDAGTDFYVQPYTAANWPVHEPAERLLLRVIT
jgi:hypothetical protein